MMNLGIPSLDCLLGTGLRFLTLAAGLSTLSSMSGTGGGSVSLSLPALQQPKRYCTINFKICYIDHASCTLIYHVQSGFPADVNIISNFPKNHMIIS